MVIEDVYQPKIEGLEPIKQARRVTALDCVLSKDPLDSTAVGYQEPEPKEERVQSHSRKKARPLGEGQALRKMTGRRGGKRYNERDENTPNDSD